MISVIIPVLNEEKSIVRALKRLKRQGRCEIIVVDGGSADNTVMLAKKYAKVVRSSRPGRGVQMNAGARKARGSILLFLHADTVLPSGAFNAIEKIDKNCAGGCFTLRFDSDSLLLRFGSRYASLRSKLIKICFGDQAMFIRKSMFRKIGGFKPYYLFEDYDLCRRLRKKGLCIIDKPVLTSARRYEYYGIVWQHIKNQILKVLFWLGVPTRFLAKLYKVRTC